MSGHSLNVLSGFGMFTNTRFFSILDKWRMILNQTNSDHPDFQQLAVALELDLKIRDGINHSYYAGLNKIDKLNHVLIAYEKEISVGCVGLRRYTDERVEIKRMYVRPTHRGQGIAYRLLTELEKWSKELGFKFCVLETGKNQPEAIALYKKANYQMIQNFEPYQESPNSICFEKSLYMNETMGEPEPTHQV